MTTPEKKPPSAEEIERLAGEMIDLKGQISTIEQEAKDEIKPLAIKLTSLSARAEAWLREFGSAHAEKSRMLHGVLYEIMGTFGTSTSIDAAAVEVFRQALVKAGKARLLKKLFRKVIRWELMPNWAETVRGAGKLPAKLAALYAQCEIKTARTPTITPREREKAKVAASA